MDFGKLGPFFQCSPAEWNFVEDLRDVGQCCSRECCDRISREDSELREQRARDQAVEGQEGWGRGPEVVDGGLVRGHELCAFGEDGDAIVLEQ